jgi:seryl-tRNA synthetase
MGMLDPKILRNNCDDVAKELSRRVGFKLDVDLYNSLEQKRHKLQDNVQSLQAIRNSNSKAVGMAKAKGENAAELLDATKSINADLKQAEVDLNEVAGKMKDLQLSLPNLLHADVPYGESENDNIVLRHWGKPKEFDFDVKDHVALGEQSGLLDMERAAKLSGARFVVLKRGLARLQRALAQFMLDTHVDEHGYNELYVPYLVHDGALIGTGQLPKFAADHFSIVGESRLHLIPTAEVPITNMHSGEIIAYEDLPIKYVAQTPCFRSEAGSYGRDTRGMIRVHQFEKVEMVHLSLPEKSYDALELLTSHAEKILQKLELPYRVVQLCSGDTGFSSAKTYDLEVWLPGQNLYREISSCSNCTDFQARRMKLRYRDPYTKKPALLHTLNGSGLAVGRALVAIMENYQDEAGMVKIPEVLVPYMQGEKII